MARSARNLILQLGVVVSCVALLGACAALKRSVIHDYAVPNAEGETVIVRVIRDTNGEMDVLTEDRELVGEERRRVLSQIWLPAAFDFPGEPFNTSMGNPDTGIRPLSP